MSQGIPPEGINVFLAQQHGHLTATKIRTSLYRNHSLVQDISEDNHYSTWFEEVRQVYPSSKILPVSRFIFL